MNALEAIHTRRSIRTFADSAVSPEQIDTLIRAAMAAPSAKNERPWRFVIVRSPETLAALAETTPWSAPIGRAPVGIVVFADTTSNKAGADMWMLDCTLAAQNMMLAAHAEGLGSVWLAVWPIPEYVAAISAILKAPEHAVPVAMFAVGVPEKMPAEVDRFEAGWIYSERYGEI